MLAHTKIQALWQSARFLPYKYHQRTHQQERFSVVPEIQIARPLISFVPHGKDSSRANTGSNLPDSDSMYTLTPPNNTAPCCKVFLNSPNQFNPTQSKTPLQSWAVSWEYEGKVTFIGSWWSPCQYDCQAKGSMKPVSTECLLTELRVLQPTLRRFQQHFSAHKVPRLFTCEVRPSSCSSTEVCHKLTCRLQ